MSEEKCNLCPACSVEVGRWFDGLAERMPKDSVTALFVLQLFAVMKSTMLTDDESLLPKALHDDLTRIDEMKEKLLAEQRQQR